MQTKHLCVLMHIRIKGEFSLSPLVIFLLTVPRWYFLRGSFFYFILCLSLLYCLAMVTYWERADFFAPMYVMSSCVFVTFPYDILGQVWHLLVSIPDLCLLPYFFSTKPPYYPLIQCSN